MDKIKLKTNHCKAVKSAFKSHEQKQNGRFRTFGPAHIKAKDYGTTNWGTCFPVTNRYIKETKEDLKREVRSAKRSYKQDIKKEIAQILLEEEYV